MSIVGFLPRPLMSRGGTIIAADVDGGGADMSIMIQTATALSVVDFVL